MNDISGDSLVEIARSISSREEFLTFLDMLGRNHQHHQDEWENSSIDSFLAAMRAFTASSEGYYRNVGADIDVDQPTWRLFADILLAARVYE